MLHNMKKIIVLIILVIVFIVFVILFLIHKNDKKEMSNNAEIINNEISNNTIIENKDDKSMNTVYNSNSWSYTKLGKIQNISSSELKRILGNGDVNIIFTLFR